MGSGLRRGEFRCQPRRRRGVGLPPTTSRQRRMAPKIAPALRVEAGNGLIRRCQCAPCRQAWLCLAPRLSPLRASTQARPQARQPPGDNWPCKPSLFVTSGSCPGRTMALSWRQPTAPMGGLPEPVTGANTNGYAFGCSRQQGPPRWPLAFGAAQSRMSQRWAAPELAPPRREGGGGHLPPPWGRSQGPGV